MPKYVDVESLHFPNICIFDMKLHGATVPMVRLVDMQKLVPAADVVEVVRCRNCKHYDCEDGDQKCVKDAEWVEDDACYYGFISYHGPEFYCAAGERKDGGRGDV